MSAKKSGSTAKKNEPEETFALREVVLAKVRGYPAWPGMVVDPDTVPKVVSKERPQSKKTTVYAIRFFPTGDYSWLGPKELQRLTKAAIEEHISKSAQNGAGRGKELLEGYKKALDPAAWEAEQAAAPPAKKKRGGKKRKGSDDEEEAVEGDAEEAVEGEAEAEAEDELADDDGASAGKKRKRTSGVAKPKPQAAKNKKVGKTKKSKAAVESEDEGAGGEEASGDAEAEEDVAENGKPRAGKKAKVDKGDAAAAAKLEADPEALKVREWRHKLQKTFLSSNKALPKEEEMPAVDKLFTTVEQYQNMNIDYLTFSKIGKVMRHIHLLEPSKVPRDNEFQFRDRAKALVDRWHQILNANKGESAAGPAGEAEKTGMNGDAPAADGEGDLTMMDTTIDESMAEA
ncbi:hypothetical protein GGX14DRAFT_482924 [Mycena pura]|uniref:PWWP domain-containing protein n=1 Tax=Mycena pura TaxID=153505 RepID=A0AAD6UMC3_9AGAR|nr:hypothetical protein GGX14DRAFT_482924 [Mycena pura]